MLTRNCIKNAPPETWGVWLVLFINTLNLLIYGAVLLVRAWVSLSPCRKRRVALVERLALWWNGFTHYWMESGKEASPFERKVRALVAEARVQRGRNACKFFVHLGAACSAGTLVTFQYYDLGTWLQLERAHWELHQSNLIQMTICFFMSTVAWLFPLHINGAYLNVFHGVIYMRLIWQVSTCASVYELIALEHTTGGIRFLAALGLGMPSFTLLLNLPLSFLKILSFETLYWSGSDADREFIYSIWGDGRSYGFHEAFPLLCAVGVAVIVDMWNYAAVRASLQAQMSSTGEKTVKSILVVLCDAVVTVDENLEFNSAATEIAQFLLRQPPNNSYQGVSFLELVEENDRDHIQQQISSSLIGHGTTLSLSARLLDGNGDLLSVQMYCTCFMDVDDCRAYVIGILELKDGTGSKTRMDTFPLQDASPTAGARGSGALHMHISSREADRDSFVSMDSMGEAIVSLVNDEGEVEIWVDLADENMPIVDASYSVRALTGPESCIGASFLDWLRPSEAAFIVNRISDEFVSFVSNSEIPSKSVILGKFHVQPGHARRAGLEYRLTMRMEMAHFQDGGSACVCLRPFGITVKKQGKERLAKRAIQVPDAASSTAAVEPSYSASSGGDNAVSAGMSL
eukprot:TRINITY_DN39151_c0_g1_i1.p1 TRINITY_DN39151_c0_g1~~TRINITY_DN39151_c0_g1_i1.p1  ORF type:complete len:630 (-),score=106.02 TRINITY_DN39151_c0_g1_i1:120-2009(-)